MTTNSNDSGSGKRQWQIYRTIDQLTAADRKEEYQIALTDPVLHILNTWARNHNSWQQSVLNKRTFLHEVEESIVALYYLDRWRREAKALRFVAVDVCGGKGIFSLLLQYMAALYWKDEAPCLDRIILLDKATSKQIDWAHLISKPPPELERMLVPVHLWEDCNLHDYDSLVDRFQKTVPQEMPLALTGIHLCKLLTPAMISLSNLLGGERCQYACLAPCCMPRAVRSKYMKDDHRGIPIFGFESASMREERLQRVLQKRLLRRKGHNNGTTCFLCQSPDHWLRQCPHFATLPRDEQSRLLQEAAAATPCWKCGVVGHFKNDCQASKKLYWGWQCEPPVARTIPGGAVLKSSNPLLTYCQLLSPSLENRKVEIVETHLNNGDKHQAENWNSGRKSLFIVAVSQ